VLDPDNRTLTEYSLANPPINNGSQIENALTFALNSNGSKAWFTEWTANYVGFVDASTNPSFSLRTLNASAMSLAPGGAARLKVRPEGMSAQQPPLDNAQRRVGTSIQICGFGDPK